MMGTKFLHPSQDSRDHRGHDDGWSSRVLAFEVITRRAGSQDTCFRALGEVPWLRSYFCDLTETIHFGVLASGSASSLRDGRFEMTTRPRIFSSALMSSRCRTLAATCANKTVLRSSHTGAHAWVGLVEVARGLSCWLTLCTCRSERMSTLGYTSQLAKIGEDADRLRRCAL